MPRITLGALVAVIVLSLTAVAQGDSGVRVRGSVASKNGTAHLVSVRSTRQVSALRVPGSLAAIRIGQKVELRGSTLRSGGKGARVLARDVTVVRTQSFTKSGDASAGDEVEITGTLMSLSPVTVQSASRTVSCTPPAGMSLAGLKLGDVVELKCDLVGGAWVVRKVDPEDGASAAGSDGEDDSSGLASDDDDDHGGSSGGSADDHDGPGGGGDD